MANRERGELTLAATGGRAYTLRLTTNACCELEDRLQEAGASSRTLDDVVRGVYAGSIREVRWLLWAALQDRHADEVQSPEDAGRVVDDAGGIRAVLARLLFFISLNRDDRPQTEKSKAEGTTRPRTAGASGAAFTATRAASA